MSANQTPSSFGLEELVHQLDMRRAPEDQRRFLRHWLSSAPPEDLCLSLTMLLQRPVGARVTIPALKKALFERINKDLFEASKEAGSDLSETLSLLWPGGNAAFDLDALSTALQVRAPATRLEAVVHLLDGADAAARDLIIRLCTGRFKSPVTPDTLRTILAETFDKPPGDIEQNLANSTPSLEPFTSWLQGVAFPEELSVQGGFVSVQPFQPRDSNALEVGEAFIAVPRGTCLELVTCETGSRFYTLRGDTEDEGEASLGLPPGLSLLVFRPADRSQPLLLLDLLMKDGEDYRARPDVERHTILEEQLQGLSPQGFEQARPRLIGEISPFDNPVVARLLIPGKAWGEATRPPRELHLIVLYVEGPVTRQGHFRGEVTLGAAIAPSDGSNIRELVPVGKAASSDLSPDHTTVLERFISTNTLERFGPVRKLAATDETCLFVRVTCHTIDPAPRRKAGLVLAGARLVEIIDNSSAFNISTLDDLQVLALL